jgi:hypothetical protein
VQNLYRVQFLPSLEALLGRLPVHHVPDSLEVFRLAVLVLETMRMSASYKNSSSRSLLVGVFPSINSEDRAELANDGVLILPLS